MDLLREINKRVRSKSDRVRDKLNDVIYGATIGLAKLYRDKALKLVKITAASAYLQALRIARKHAQLLFIAVFAAIMLAVTVVVVPIALVLVTDCPMAMKFWAVAVLGLLDVLIVTVIVHYIYSEDKWLKRTGLQDLLDSLDSSKK